MAMVLVGWRKRWRLVDAEAVGLLQHRIGAGAAGGHQIFVWGKARLEADVAAQHPARGSGEPAGPAAECGQKIQGFKAFWAYCHSRSGRERRGRPYRKTN